MYACNHHITPSFLVYDQDQYIVTIEIEFLSVRLSLVQALDLNAPD